MVWLLCAIALGAALVGLVRLAGPRVPAERVAVEDLDLVRDADRVRWRARRLRAYRLDKRQDDSYRMAAFRKRTAAGLTEDVARAEVRKEFPFFYLDPADRDIEGYSGDDGALPVVLRDRVSRRARVLKELMGTEGEHFRTMNALVRRCIRKGAI